MKLYKIYEHVYFHNFTHNLTLPNYHILTKVESDYSYGEKVIRECSEVFNLFFQYVPYDFPWEYNSCVISGSFLIKILLKHLNIEEFPDTDIDIYIFDKDVFQRYINYFESKQVINKKIIFDNNYSSIFNVYSLHEYNINGYPLTFQLICLDNPSIHIFESFDCTHNQVLYNGSNFLGTLDFLKFLYSQQSVIHEINPARILKFISLKISLIARHSFEKFPDVFYLLEKNKYAVKFNLIDCKDYIEGIFINNIPIELKYYGNKKHVEFLQKGFLHQLKFIQN